MPAAGPQRTIFESIVLGFIECGEIIVQEKKITGLVALFRGIELLKSRPGRSRFHNSSGQTDRDRKPKATEKCFQTCMR
jgi:hypothetical protein